MKTSSSLLAGLFLVATLTHGVQSTATDVERILPFVDPQTIAVVSLDPASIDQPTLDRLVKLTGFLPSSMRMPIWRLLAEQEIDQAFLIVGLADYPESPSFVVFQRPASWTDADLQRMTDNSLLKIELIHDQLVLAMPKTIERLRQIGENEKQAQVRKAFRQATNDAIQVALVLNDDQRRVIAEVWQKTINQYVDFDAQKLTKIDDVRLSLDSLQNVAVEIVAAPKDADAGKELLLAVETTLVNRLTLPGFTIADADAGRSAKATIDLSQAWCRDHLDPWIEQHNRRLAVRKFFHLTLAIHNHHSAYGELPPASVSDADGNPLLSWRVKLLPFLDRKYIGLWRQFHMDEPWDSPHNRKLISQMPEEYQVDSTSPIGIESTVAVPYGEAMVFHEGRSTFDQISDGMFDTIMFVEIPEDRADIWTKPGGISIFPDDPGSGLGHHFGQETLVALVAGSAAWLDVEKYHDVLYALFTRNGGEQIKYPGNKEPKPKPW